MSTETQARKFWLRYTEERGWHMWTAARHGPDRVERGEIIQVAEVPVQAAPCTHDAFCGRPNGHRGQHAVAS